MTALLEKLIAAIAPHRCIVCSSTNNILCEACADDAFGQLLSLCVFCGVPTVDWRPCRACQKTTALQTVCVAGEYKGAVATLLRQFKFERAKAAHVPLASALNDALPYYDPQVQVVAMPTASSRIRQRGYDHTWLVARHFARLRGLQLVAPLARRHSARQVGAGRTQRQAQAKNAYMMIRPNLVKGKHVLLIDDICTTGASLSAAAKLLQKAGARRVDAAVCAWQPLKK